MRQTWIDRILKPVRICRDHCVRGWHSFRMRTSVWYRADFERYCKELERQLNPEPPQ